MKSETCLFVPGQDLPRGGGRTFGSRLRGRFALRLGCQRLGATGVANRIGLRSGGLLRNRVSKHLGCSVGRAPLLAPVMVRYLVRRRGGLRGKRRNRHLRLEGIVCLSLYVCPDRYVAGGVGRDGFLGPRWDL